MSLLTWLTRKSAVSAAPDAPSSDLGQLDATLPIAHAPAVRTKPDADAPHSKRKALRMEQRELLYAVVRECMTKSGILSSSYKFKVLSLDSRGKDYLVMVDLPPANMAHPHRLVDIEGLIARHAKALHDILVTAVYWRVNDQVSTEVSPQEALLDATSNALVAVEPPTRQQHVEAFKQSFAANEMNHAPTVARSAVNFVSTQQASTTDFADTEIEEPHSPMSRTQYGDLN
jgi:hypothetical protein